jgi:hypothetical protein
MEDDPGSPAEEAPPIAEAGGNQQHPAMQRAQIAVIPPGGTVVIAGVPLRYRLDRSQAWSYLHYRHGALAESAGTYIKVTPSARRASEKRVMTPWGELMVLLWDLGPDIDLVAGREALGGPSPCPWRPFIFSDKPKVRPNPTNGTTAVAAPLVGERPGQQIGGRVVLFPGRATR